MDRAMNDRDAWLRMDDARLLATCREKRYRASGPGGQRRNKVETAVRLRHEPTGLTVQAEEARSLEENRRKALRRLRERLALHVRGAFDLDSPSLPPEFRACRRDGRIAINPKNETYPVVVATALDALAAARGSYAAAARALGVTTSQLVRFLRANPAAWAAASRLRAGPPAERP